MYLSLFVIFVLLSVANSTPILVSECGKLNNSFTTYHFAHDIVVSDTSYGFVCLDITGEGITLDGRGFELAPASKKMLHATGVQSSGESAIVTNIHITNMRTGILAKGKYGEIFNNTITHAINGIDVSATHNRIQNNIIGQFEAYESTAGIYVYFPAIAPVDSFINITNNVISDIKGDSFALGISVYYATSVFIAHNFIFNLQGGISSQEISVINGLVDSVGNSFNPPTSDGTYTQLITVLASLFALLASLVYYQSSSLSLSPTPVSLPQPTPVCESEKEREEKKKEKEKDEKEKEKDEKEREREDFELDGADVVKTTMSISLGSSPNVR